MATKDISNRSKRFYNGSIHEIQGGKIRILDRFLAEDEKTVMLKYEMVETGQIITNKEVNVSASIYKFSRIKKESGLETADENMGLPTNNSEKSENGIHENVTQIIIPKEFDESVQKLFSEAMSKLGELEQQQQEDLLTRAEFYEDLEKLIGNIDLLLKNYVDQRKHLEFIWMQQETIQRQQSIIENLTNKVLGFTAN